MIERDEDLDKIGWFIVKGEWESIWKKKEDREQVVLLMRQQEGIAD